jgi:hypothetical protein
VTKIRNQKSGHAQTYPCDQVHDMKGPPVTGSYKKRVAQPQKTLRVSIGDVHAPPLRGGSDPSAFIEPFSS